MRVERKRMGDMLLAEGAVTAEQIDEALEASKREGIKLGESLVRLGYVTEDTIAQALSNQLKIERVHLAEEFVDDSFVKMIPGDVLRRYIMIPLCYEKDNVNRVRVAMSDPMDMRPGRGQILLPWMEWEISPRTFRWTDKRSASLIPIILDRLPVVIISINFFTMNTERILSLER